MKYGKIVTMKIIYNDVNDGKTVINTLKQYAKSLAILKRCEVEYITEEPCVDRVE
jgi:hypothetical protein|tara:strand:- start:71 stop:235 length:165 start_codon:yes stop_codon:yes gene_type:complete